MTDEEILKRLETERPSRELDGVVFIKSTPGVSEAGQVDHAGDGIVGWWPKDGPYMSAREVPRYTSSLDAKLPGENIEVVLRHTYCWVAGHYSLGNQGVGATDGTNPYSEAMARRAAAWRARMER